MSFQNMHFQALTKMIQQDTQKSVYTWREEKTGKEMCQRRKKLKKWKYVVPADSSGHECTCLITNQIGDIARFHTMYFLVYKSKYLEIYRAITLQIERIEYRGLVAGDTLHMVTSKHHKPENNKTQFAVHISPSIFREKR